MYNTNHFKVRSTVLKRLGYANYKEYLRSDWWQRRRATYATAIPQVCTFCGDPADDLHHKSYKRLGAEQDDDLVWLCRHHHAEAHTRGFVGRPTARMTDILKGHGYTDAAIGKMSFGDAFDRIDGIGRGVVATPNTEVSSPAVADDHRLIAILLDSAL